METSVKGYISNIKAHVIRLLPDMDLYQELIKYLKNNCIKAACIVSCVGSLKKINLRTATGYNFIKREEFFEIVSLTGSISCDRCHLHICLSDKNGKTIGGHLMRDENIVFTTAEIVLGEFPNLIFSEEMCDKSGWPELKINENDIN